MTKDMTTGNPIKLILTFSIPLLIGSANFIISLLEFPLVISIISLPLSSLIMLPWYIVS